MWTEIGTGAGFIAIAGLGGLVLKMQTTRIKKVEGCKQDTTMCNQRYTEIKEDLTAGDKKFEKIMTTLGSQGETLARIEERVGAIAKRNRV